MKYYIFSLNKRQKFKYALHNLSYSNLYYGGILTHLSQMNFPISIGRTRLFQTLGVLGGIFHVYSNSNRTFCGQTVETLIRRHILWRLIWVCAVCLCPTKRMLGLYGLK